MDSVEGLVKRADPDRWRTARLAPAAERGHLMALYAFNLEIARAAWAPSERALGAIRLAWWRDALAEIPAGAPSGRHELVPLLAAAMAARALPPELFERMIAARATELEGRPANVAALVAYVDGTAGALMELAARTLGAGEGALPPVRTFARGAGIAALLRALPALRAHQRDPMPPGVTAPALARDGLAALAAARAERQRVPAGVAPALLAGWRAEQFLAAVAGGADPADAEAAPIVDRWDLLWRGVSGRW